MAKPVEIRIAAHPIQVAIVRTKATTRAKKKPTLPKYRWEAGWLCVLDRRDRAVCWTLTPAMAKAICHALNTAQRPQP